jgi:hypothetical protein
MTNLNLAHEHRFAGHSHNHSHNHSPSVIPLWHGFDIREVDWTMPEDVAVVDLIELYLEIEAALATEHGMVVQFLPASAGPGAAQVALDMAWATASVLGKKALVLNCTHLPWTPWPHTATGLLGDGIIQPIPRQAELMKIPGHEMYMADLRNGASRVHAIARTDLIGDSLTEFSRHFEMVLVVAPPADQEPLGAMLAGKVDGNILVIEAERTRQSAAIRLRELLARCGRPILGAVLNDRRNHLPGWLTHIL